MEVKKKDLNCKGCDKLLTGYYVTELGKFCSKCFEKFTKRGAFKK